MNKKIILAGCSLVLMFSLILLILVALPLYHEYSVYQIVQRERMGRLRTLLCEDIKLGMSKEQVISILEQKGEVRINGNYDEPNLNLGIVFIGPEINEYYGPFSIVISDYKYIGSYMDIGFEKYETICSLR